MAELMINGIPVSFPFEPYDVQKQYMEKVIECLQKGVNGVLESPTGTGKTLSLLCSSLAWLMVKKAQLQAQLREGMFELSDGDYVAGLQNSLSNAGGIVNSGESSMWGVPKIIYASRTHSQLSQVMQELKRTNYSHVKVAVLGSRDQMCIHPEVSRETSNSGKVHMCRLRVSSRTCYFYNNVESKKDDTAFRKGGILDIEDLVSVGRKLRCCPYYVSKELKSQADIIFMPYNYLLDPKTRRAQGVEVANNVILLDEAHNIEKICEESASLQIRSTDVALCIDEVTQVMKDISELPSSYPEESSTANRDFTAEDLCILKTMFLELEKAVDEIPASEEGITYPGSYILDLLAKAEITHGKRAIVLDLVDKLVLYLSTTGTSPYARRGVGLQKFSDLLKIVFSSDIQTLDHINNIKTAYKVHVKFEEVKSSRSDSWGPRTAPQPVNKRGRLISYWCFSPGYSMKQLQEQGIRCLILTSGTLSPLPALISELGIKIDVQLENPHIVKHNQVCVGIVSRGPDGYELNSSYSTRNSTEYMSSLGRCILNLSHIIPHGLLIFFPSYPIMLKCRDHWQEEGLWTRLSNCKTVYVEPQGKDSFLATMAEYYNKIVDPSSPGACFMAVTRGKVSEGLDFSDNNGRAVIVTGLPYPPFKDPRVQLKRQYLDEVQRKKSENLSGSFWYQLEASRAVNQAIGRVIRHANDYGAILLCDKRFDNPGFKKQLSLWLQPYIKLYKDFGAAVKDVKQFFKSAEKCLPAPKSRGFSIVKDCNKIADKIPAPVPASFDLTARVTARSSVSGRTNSNSQSSLVVSDWSPNDYTQSETVDKTSTDRKQSLDFFGALNKPTNTIDFNDTSLSSSCKRQLDDSENLIDCRKRKLKLVPVNFNASTSRYSVLTEEISDNKKEPGKLDNKKSVIERQENSENNVPKKSAKATEITDYIKQVKSMLSTPKYKEFIAVVGSYSKDGDIDVLLQVLQEVFITDGLYTLLRGFQRFIKTEHLDRFKKFCRELDSKNSVKR